MTDRNQLADMIEQQWTQYNTAALSRLHPQVYKEAIANIVINNAKTIIAALRAEAKPTETVDVVLGDKSAPSPKKIRK